MLRKYALASVCAASALFAANPLAEAVAAATAKPNIVTIVIDDMGFSDMGYFGGEAQTPNMDALAGGGIALTNFYAAPTSTPSRAQFFTGRDHHMVGVGNMGGLMAWSGDTELMQQPGYEGRLTPDVPIIAEVLKQNGYQTMMTGKWDMGEDSVSEYPESRGFEVTKGLLLPGGDIQYLSDANGNLLTTQVPAYYTKYGRTTPYMENGQPVTTFPPNSYSTEYYTDSAIAMLQNRDTSRPFYLNIAHIAPHTPWQAPPEVTAKYIDIYMKGWDVLRQERFERQKASGIVPQNAPLPPRRAGLRAWDSLTPAQQKVEANKMAVYAAMVEMVDRSVGRLVQHLKDTGQYENTVFALYSDNGGESSNVSMVPGSPQRDYIMSHYQTPEDPNFDPNNYQNMGDASWVVSPNPEWAMLMNTPFNRHKVNLFDGGYHVPAILHYPQAKAVGVKYDCMQSVLDFVPTLLDTAQVTYPTEWNGKPLAPLQGQSMSGLFNGNFSCNADRVLATEFDGMKAVRHAGWALSQGRFDDTWYLFNLEQDPFESNDLKALYPDKFAELVGYYQQYVKENRVYEVSAKYLLPLTDNSATASLTGGTSVNGMVPWAKQATAKTTDYVDMSAFVRVAPEDVGQVGEVFAYGRFTPAGGGQPLYFDMSENRIGVRPINGLRAFASKPLPTSMPLPIYQGRPNFPGVVEVVFGYKVGGKTVKNDEWIKLTVSAN